MSVTSNWNEPAASGSVRHACRPWKHGVSLLMLGGGVVGEWGSNMSLWSGGGDGVHVSLSLLGSLMVFTDLLDGVKP